MDYRQWSSQNTPNLTKLASRLAATLFIVLFMSASASLCLAQQTLEEQRLTQIHTLMGTEGSSLNASTAIKAGHINGLRTFINNQRSACGGAGLGPYTWTDNPIVPGVTPIRAVHFQELRTAYNEIFTNNSSQSYAAYSGLTPLMSTGTYGAVSANTMNTTMNAMSVATCCGDGQCNGSETVANCCDCAGPCPPPILQPCVDANYSTACGDVTLLGTVSGGSQIVNCTGACTGGPLNATCTNGIWSVTGSCVSPYSCTNAPSNLGQYYERCSTKGDPTDETSLSADTNWSYTNSCTSAKCELLILCGNGICEPLRGELIESCSSDCSCGDGICDMSPGEDSISCPSDCPASCKNGTCDAGETADNCPSDCTGCFVNGYCQGNEDCSSCPADCPAVVTPWVNEGCGPPGGYNYIVGGPGCPYFYQQYQTNTSCGVPGSQCVFDPSCSCIEDGVCNTSVGEDSDNCFDCYCGDNLCTGSEDATNCAADCHCDPAVIDDNGCSISAPSADTQQSASSFCTGVGCYNTSVVITCVGKTWNPDILCPRCGDGVCTSGETSANCPSECI